MLLHVYNSYNYAVTWLNLWVLHAVSTFSHDISQNTITITLKNNSVCKTLYRNSILLHQDGKALSFDAWAQQINF